MGRCGKRFRVCSDVRFSHMRKLYVGDDVFIGPNSVLLIRESITIEDEVQIAHKALLTSTNHGYANGSFWNGKNHTAPITIKRGAWVGAQGVVLPGVTIGRGSVIGANSVANRSIPDYSVAAGIPATVKKELEIPEGETRNVYETIPTVTVD